MKTISMLILFAAMFLFANDVFSQSENSSPKEVICPCMLEYDFNSDVRESLNTGEDFHPVLKFKNAEIKDGVMICNYDKVFYKLSGSSSFEFVNYDSLKDKWTNKGLAVINYYSSQKFEASVLNYIYGDISTAHFDSSFTSFSLLESSNPGLYLSSGGDIKLDENQNGFLITRNDVIKMMSLSPVSGVPTKLGKTNSMMKPNKLK